MTKEDLSIRPNELLGSFRLVFTPDQIHDTASIQKVADEFWSLFEIKPKYISISVQFSFLEKYKPEQAEEILIDLFKDLIETEKEILAGNAKEFNFDEIDGSLDD